MLRSQAYQAWNDHRHILEIRGYCHAGAMRHGERGDRHCKKQSLTASGLHSIATMMALGRPTLLASPTKVPI